MLRIYILVEVSQVQIYFQSKLTVFVKTSRKFLKNKVFLIFKIKTWTQIKIILFCALLCLLVNIVVNLFMCICQVMFLCQLEQLESILIGANLR